MLPGPLTSEHLVIYAVYLIYREIPHISGFRDAFLLSNQIKFVRKYNVYVLEERASLNDARGFYAAAGVNV